MNLGLKFRLFLYTNRISLDILVFIIIDTIMVMNNIESTEELIDIKTYLPRIVFNSFPSLTIFILSRLIFKDRRLYNHDEWKFFLPSVTGIIASLIILGNLVHVGIGVLNAIYLIIILIIISFVTPLYDTDLFS